MIPDRGANAITIMFVFVMMKMMISPKRFHPLKRGIPGVNSIMHGTIHKVTENKTGEEHKSSLAHDEVHQTKNGGSQNNTGNGRHKKAFSVARVMMMIAMKDINYIFRSFTFSASHFGPSRLGRQLRGAI